MRLQSNKPSPGTLWKTLWNMTIAVDQETIQSEGKQEIVAQLWTDSAFMALSEKDGPYELVNGEVSPSNTFEEIHNKLVEYFESGCQLAWVIHPNEQWVMVYQQPQPDRLLKPTDTLEGGSVIPGFTLPVADLFAELDF